MLGRIMSKDDRVDVVVTSARHLTHTSWMWVIRPNYLFDDAQSTHSLTNKNLMVEHTS